MSILDIQMDRRELLRGGRKAKERPSGAKPPADAEALLLFDASVCWALQGIDPDCDYCFDRCPLKGEAVTLDVGRGPVFNPGACTGCGICTYYCPATPRPLSLKPL